MGEGGKMTNVEARNDFDEETFWEGAEASLVVREDAAPMLYDLEERTAKFGEAVIDFAKKNPDDGPIPHRTVSRCFITLYIR